MEEFHKRSSKKKKSLKHIFGRYSLEERKQIKEKSRVRRSDPQRHKKRRRGWGGEEDEEAFEKIHVGRDRVLGHGAGIARTAPTEEAEAPITGGVLGSVLSVRRTSVLVGVNGHEVEARVVHGLSLAVGDAVRVADLEAGAPRVIAAEPRRTELKRPDPGGAHQALVLAANVDLAVLVQSVKAPSLRVGLIDRFLIALAYGGVEPVLCVNKLDLLPGYEGRVELERALMPYRELGLPVVMTSAETGEGVERLRELVRGNTCVFVGHSGTGKSSLLNALHPEGDRVTGGVRTSDGKGRHTTTGSELVELEGGTRLIDTPGIRAFGLWQLDAAALRAAIPEFEPLAPACRFSDCSHVHEPDCAVLAALEAGTFPRARYDAYRRILESLR